MRETIGSLGFGIIALVSMSTGCNKIRYQTKVILYGGLRISLDAGTKVSYRWTTGDGQSYVQLESANGSSHIALMELNEPNQGPLNSSDRVSQAIDIAHFEALNTHIRNADKGAALVHLPGSKLEYRVFTDTNGDLFMAGGYEINGTVWMVIAGDESTSEELLGGVLPVLKEIKFSGSYVSSQTNRYNISKAFNVELPMDWDRRLDKIGKQSVLECLPVLSTNIVGILDEQTPSVSTLEKHLVSWAKRAVKIHGGNISRVYSREVMGHKVTVVKYAIAENREIKVLRFAACGIQFENHILFVFISFLQPTDVKKALVQLIPRVHLNAKA